MKPARLSARAAADLSLLGVTAIWGATFVMVKDALAEVGPLSFLALRFWIAALVLAPLVLALRGWPPRALLLHGSLVGAFLFAGYLLQTVGLQFTSASKAGFITGLSVVIVPLLLTVGSRRPPARPTLAGVALATVGLALLTLGDDVSVRLGDLLVLGCALAFALHILALGVVAPRHDVLGLTAVQITAAAALSTAGALAFEQPRGEPLAAVLPAAIFTGLLATVAAYALQTRAQRSTTPTHTALIFSMEPVFAALFGFLLGGERLAERALLGCGLILAGMLVAQLAPEHEPPTHEPFG